MIKSDLNYKLLPRYDNQIIFFRKPGPLASKFISSVPEGWEESRSLSSGIPVSAGAGAEVTIIGSEDAVVEES